MTRDEAKFVLQVCKDDAGASSPEMVEALSMASRDPELSQWLAREREFDEVFSRQLETTPPPVGLQEKLLTLAPQQNQEEAARSGASVFQRLCSPCFLRTIGSMAAAAGLVIFFAIIVFDPRAANADSEVPEFFQTIQEEMLTNSVPRVAGEDPESLYQFLEENKAPRPAPLPSPIDSLKQTGASTLEVKGKESRVGVLFLEDDAGRKFRLFIAPIDAPDPVAPILPDMSLKEFEHIALLTWKNQGKVHALVTHEPASVLETLR